METNKTKPKDKDVIDTIKTRPKDDPDITIKVLQARSEENRKTMHQRTINTISFLVVGGWFAIILFYILAGMIGICAIQSNTPIEIIDKVGTILISLIIGFYFSDYLRR